MQRRIQAGWNNWRKGWKQEIGVQSDVLPAMTYAADIQERMKVAEVNKRMQERWLQWYGLDETKNTRPGKLGRWKWMETGNKEGPRDGGATA